MKKLCISLCAMVLFSLFSIAVLGQGPSKGGEPKPGGRPGKFMFATNEELAADKAQRAEVRAKLAEMRAKAEALAKNPSAKKQLLQNVALFESFVNAVEQRQNHTSSETSQHIVNLLNEKKGKTQCTFCHLEDGDKNVQPARRGK